MPLIFIPPPLRELTGGVSPIEVDGRTVGEAIQSLNEKYPGIRDHLCHGEALMPGLQVSIGEMMSTRGLLARVQPNSEIHFLPAFGGG